MIISDHAFRRYLERSKPSQYTKIANELEQAYKQNIKLDPVNRLRSIFTNKFRETTYLKGNNCVLVIREEEIVSVIPYVKEQWK